MFSLSKCTVVALAMSLIAVSTTLAAGLATVGAEKFDSETTVGILRNDPTLVFDELSDRYDTPLKRRVFNKSAEAAEYRKQTKVMKKELGTKVFFVNLGFINGDYNLKKKAFPIKTFDHGNPRFTLKWPHYRQYIDGCVFKKLRVKWIDTYDGTLMSYYRDVTIKVPEEEAVEIEEVSSQSDLEIKVYFTLQKRLLKSTKLEDNKFVRDYFPVAKRAEVHFINSTTEDIIYISKLR